jgi:hypothetical protein
MEPIEPGETPAQYLSRIGSLGGSSKSKAKREAARENVAKAQKALAAKRKAKRKKDA